MTGFIFAVLGLLVLALIIVLPALIRVSPGEHINRREQNIEIAKERLEGLRLALEEGDLNQEQFDQERMDLEAGLLDDIDATEETSRSSSSYRWAAILVLLGLPAFSVGLYLYLGTPAVFDAQFSQAHLQDGKKLPSIAQMVAQLEQRLQQNPEDIDGWYMLYRTYMTLQQYDKAVAAMRKVRKLAGDEPAVLADLADAVAMSQGGSLTGEPVKMLSTVLKTQPDNPKALWLLGMEGHKQRNPGPALEHWYRLEPLLASEPEAQQEVRQLISMAEKMAGVEPKKFSEETSTASTSGQVKVSVDIDPELSKGLTGNETLFILARAKNGPPMPLAVARHVVSDLPLTVTLDDSMAMTPMSKLSGFDDVEVLARVSRSGQAMPQTGDLFGRSEQVVKPGNSPVVQITINQVQQ
jgi:cytochrome c-type biogenesis protein CcmH